MSVATLNKQLEEQHLKNLDRASDNSARAYLIYLGFILYSLLTIAGTTDEQIVLKHAGVNLPIINVEIALSAFFIVAPLMMLGVFLYLMIAINRLHYLEKKLRTYESAESAGVTIPRRIYPWWALVIFDDSESEELKRLQRWLGIISIWWLMPFTLFMSMLWTIKKHSWEFSYFAFAMFFIGTWLAIWFSSRFKTSTDKTGFWSIYENNHIRSFLTSLLILFQLYLCIPVIPWVHEGAPWDFKQKKFAVPVLSRFDELENDTMIFVRSFFILNLSHKNLTNKPDDPKEYPDLFWADFNEVNLKGADLSYSVLEQADLRGAQLKNAYVFYSVLKNADLTGANLQGANLSKANLQGANLSEANLQKAILLNANFQDATLIVANLQNATLSQANLQNADLRLANLQNVDLRWANFQKAKGFVIEQLCTAKTLYQATFEGAECNIGEEKRKHSRGEGNEKVEWDYWEGGEKIDCIEGIMKTCPD